jgi:thiol-disulfide isomerase/thioredoxin
MKFRFLFFIVSLLLISCGQRQENEQTTEKIPNNDTTAVVQKNELPKKDSTFFIKTAIGSLPVYNTFSSVASMFQKNNDTTYIINFWATWCKPCIKELPYFEQVQAQYQNNKVQVILISIDSENQLNSKLIPFLQANPLKSKVIVLTDNDYNSWTPQVDERWSGAIPVTYFYKGGKKVFHSKSFADAEEVKGILKQVL